MSNEIVETIASTDVVESGRNQAGAIRSSIDMSTKEGKLAVLNAVQSAEPLEEHLNEEFSLKNIVMQAVQVVASTTGELVDATRTILVTESGDAYTTVSDTVAKDIVTIMSIMGNADDWGGALTVKVEAVKGNRGRFYKLITVNK